MTWTRNLLTGLAELLAANGVGEWNPSGIYSTGQTAITIGGLPTTPDRAVSIAVYGPGRTGDDIDHADSSVQVQLRFRAGKDPRDVDDLADAAFDALHGLEEWMLSTGVLVLLSQRRIVAPLERDANGRRERADSYELLCHRPSPHRG